MLGTLSESDLNEELKKIAKEINIHGLVGSYTKPGVWGGKLRLSIEEKEGSYKPYFHLDRFPLNCNILIMSNLGYSYDDTKLKLNVMDAISYLFGHSGVMLSNVHFNSDSWKVYEDCGFIPLLTDYAIQHESNQPMGVYYKPMNQDRKVETSGKLWEQVYVGKSPSEVLSGGDI